ncbi:MAG: LLM class flavin-dependent oxidoreductase [Pseudomonadales bacterium]|nr:LLM class flavin-dependent oxidoreductase [Pseudomonadales bacterium]MCP5185253.1 LLM class flavin-dependent oxidoreductase [Pseudomonadales bacterium]
MRMGALLGPVADAGQPRFLAEQARRYEGEGFSSLWMAQAVGRGFMFPDPLLALAVAATVTNTVEIGTAVLQLPLYPVMDLAHRVFTLQQICGDRLRLGLGAGSTAQDFAAFERSYERRFQTFNTSLAALRDVFVNGNNGRSSLTPWPSVRGGPPLFFGTWGNGVERAAREFDGWIASANYRTVDEVVAAAGRFHAAGGKRAIVSTIQVMPDTDTGELREKLARFRAAGFDDAVVMLHPGAMAAADVRKLLT